MNAQHVPFGGPVLHGKYMPVGHEAPHFTFYHNGEFRSYWEGERLSQERVGAGEWALEGDSLQLVYSEEMQDRDHTLVYTSSEEQLTRIKVIEQDGMEVMAFRMLVDGRMRKWVRHGESLPYREKE